MPPPILLQDRADSLTAETKEVCDGVVRQSLADDGPQKATPQARRRPGQRRQRLGEDRDERRRRS